MFTNTLDLLGKDLQIGNYFLYFCAARHGNITICKIIDITEKGFKCKIVNFLGRTPFEGNKIIYYDNPYRMFKIDESQLSEQVLNLLNKEKV